MWRKRLSRWRTGLRTRRWLLLIGALVLGAVFHAPLLQLLASVLIDGDPIAPADCLVVFEGDGKYDAAQKLYFQGLVRRVALVREPADRLVQHRIVPPKHEIALRELTKRDIPASAIVVLPAEAANVWEMVDSVGLLLQSGEAQSVAILAERFESRTLQHVVNSVLDDEQQDRTSVLALQDRRYTEADWWKGKAGIGSFVSSGMSYAYTLFHGRDSAASPPWGVDALERQLR